jgi:GDP-4-dehydro-6-deoxy-D-mannose reductase
VQPRRILVTGGSGFVGSHLLPRLRGAFPDSEIVATALANEAGLRRLDVADPHAVDDVIRAVRPDACVHLAAIAAIPSAGRDPDLAWRVNLHGALALVRALLDSAPKCWLLFVSSADIYGASFRAGVPLDETALPAPMNTYAATKAAADLALGAMAHEGLRVVRLRPFNHIGPGQSSDFVVAAFARQIARIRAGLQPPVLRVGALDPARDFLDVRDVCAAYAACLARIETLPPGTILNIASGTPRRIGDVLAALLAAAGVEARIETDPDRLRRADIPLAIGDASRARALLGWAPTIPWETTVTDVLADWQARIAPERF